MQFKVKLRIFTAKNLRKFLRLCNNVPMLLLTFEGGEQRCRFLSPVLFWGGEEQKGVGFFLPCSFFVYSLVKTRDNTQNRFFLPRSFLLFTSPCKKMKVDNTFELIAWRAVRHEFMFPSVNAESHDHKETHVKLFSERSLKMSRTITVIECFFQDPSLLLLY